MVGRSPKWTLEIFHTIYQNCQFEKLLDSGVTIAIGTDAGNIDS
jgi:imidazolonepropionase-like amidohydrolase